MLGHGVLRILELQNNIYSSW